MSDKPISPLRRRMIEDMTVRNFVEETRNNYIRHVNAVQRRPSAKSRAVPTRKLATLPGRWPRPRRSSNHPATGNVSKCCLRT